MRAKFFFALPVLYSATVYAQETPTAMTVQQFQPATGAGNFFSVESAQLLAPYELVLRLSGNVADDPLVATSLDDGREVRIIDSQLTFNAIFSIGLSQRFELGFDFPVTAFQRGDGSADLAALGLSSELKPTGIGDFRLVPKIRLVGKGSEGFGLLFIPGFTLPIGDKGAFLGERAVLRPGLAASYLNKSYELGANLTYRVRSENSLADLVVNDDLLYGLAGFVPVSRGKMPLGLIAEFSGALAVQSPASNTNPAEVHLGARIAFTDELSLSGGLGVGLSQGIGAPDVRGLATFSWLDRGDADTDNDGLINDKDACPSEAEDKDKFQDSDGCPEFDNDLDSVLDAADKCPDTYGSPLSEGCPLPDSDSDSFPDPEDKCPNEAEDKDNFEDADGCPDNDNDQDAITDALDKCPSEAEDKDSFEDEDGCPDLDNDQDGVLDGDDKCVLVAEDKDVFEDADGCPDADNDQDAILDPQDACPNEPETFNGEKDEDGCPDAAATATLTETGVAITEQVLFATGKDEVAPASYKLLDGVAAILKLHPEITRLRIEGHTDNKGAKAKNLALSERRAAAVLKYLTEKAGIDGARLVSQGFGPEFPVATNKTNEGRAQNRRVEFVLLEKNGAPVVLEARKVFEEAAPAPKPPAGTGKKPTPKPASTEAPVPKRPKTEGEKPKPKPGAEDVPVPKRRR